LRKSGPILDEVMGGLLQGVDEKSNGQDVLSISSRDRGQYVHTDAKSLRMESTYFALSSQHFMLPLLHIR
jgi:hypothetical protein